MVADRLDRIENKLDKNTELVITGNTILQAHIENKPIHKTTLEIKKDLNGKLNGGLPGKATIGLIGIVTVLVTIVANLVIR